MITSEMYFQFVLVIFITIRNYEPMFATNVQINLFFNSIVLVLHVPKSKPLLMTSTIKFQHMQTLLTNGLFVVTVVHFE
jgi:hypothetical protein